MYQQHSAAGMRRPCQSSGPAAVHVPAPLQQHCRPWQPAFGQPYRSSWCRVQSQHFSFEGAGGDRLASEFSAHLNQLSLKAPLQHRRPSPLDPPTAAVASQLDALQINDWPEPDAGVQTALAFAKPYECERLLTAAPQAAGSSPRPSVRLAGRRRSSGGSGDDTPASTDSSPSSDGLSSRVRSWAAQEQWLTPQEFSELLHSSPYDVLLGCDTWRACSEMVFPATRVGKRAVQAVEVLAGSGTAAAAAAAAAMAMQQQMVCNASPSLSAWSSFTQGRTRAAG
ncbi:hypothetical protein COO60DRAFT_1625392 [Scenedesmus sp. NREL 46B-D3]|nr:hypothetical protein COO60DRAFT_1625392 [Scenedesmus sp. NREL 46B-D3]